VDLEAYEMSIRSRMHAIGGRMLEALINSDGGDYRGRRIKAEAGQSYEFMEYREKKLLTVLGPIRLKRAYYYDRQAQRGWCPKDRQLDIVGSSYSCGVRRMMSKVGAYRSFGLGQQDLYELAGIRVSAKEVERVSEMVGQQVEAFHQAEAGQRAAGVLEPIRRMYVGMDGSGVPVVKKEAVGRAGKDGGQAKSREAKLGCVFTQSGVDAEGWPVRDEGSTSYAGAIEAAEVFGWRIYQEAQRRGVDVAQELIVLGDGAPWIWNIADEHFPGCIQIVDLYHAREHYWNAGRGCFGQQKEKLHQWAEQRRQELDAGKIEAVIEAIGQLSALSGYNQEVCEREIGYFEKNKERMRYAEFRSCGLFVGSGVLEAGCRTVIGQRLKQSGMHWTVRGANSILSLRCNILSNRWEDFWEYRAAA
jgi:hypothetical protein